MIIGGYLFQFSKLPQIDRAGSTKMSYGEINKLLRLTGASDVYVNDLEKDALPIQTWRDLMTFDYVAQRKYVAEYFDCEDFSQSLMGTITDICPNTVFGLVEVERRDLPKDSNKNYQLHMLNFCISSDKQIWFIEPQNKSVFQNSLYKPIFFYC